VVPESGLPTSKGVAVAGVSLPLAPITGIGASDMTSADKSRHPNATVKNRVDIDNILLRFDRKSGTVDKAIRAAHQFWQPIANPSFQMNSHSEFNKYIIKVYWLNKSNTRQKECQEFHRGILSVCQGCFKLVHPWIYGEQSPVSGYKATDPGNFLFLIPK
jgi:hypothetical protein